MVRMLGKAEGKTITTIEEKTVIGEPYHNTKGLILHFTDGTTFEFWYGANGDI